MQIRSARYVAVLIVILIVVGLSFVDAGAQRRRKRHRRVTTASRPAPSPSPAADEASDPSDPRIVSTADQSTSTTSRSTRARTKSSPTPTPESEQEQLRRTITDLRSLLDLERLSRAEERLSRVEERLSRTEQRAETFRAQLRDVLAKEVELQGQLDQVDFALQPENIERAVANFGTTHPEVARDQRRRQLESQKTRWQAQYDQLEKSRVRLEAAIATADAEVEKVQRQIELNNQQLNQPPITTPKPIETPPEARPPQSLEIPPA